MISWWSQIKNTKYLKTCSILNDLRNSFISKWTWVPLKNSKEPWVLPSFFKITLRLLVGCKQAEENETKRIELITAALSMINDVLPFDSSNQIVWEDREIVKNLILCLPEFPKPVGLPSLLRLLTLEGILRALVPGSLSRSAFCSTLFFSSSKETSFSWWTASNPSNQSFPFLTSTKKWSTRK